MCSYRRLLIALVACLTLGTVSACSPGSDLPLLPNPPESAYKLGAGDQVRIITFGDEQLTGEFRISDSGNLALPLLGTVHAAGLTIPQLESTIADDLQQKNLFKNPSVSAEVVAYRPIFILGEVAKPGRYPYQPGMTLLTAVSIAGGFTYRAVKDYASVVRTMDGKPVEGRITRESYVKPGDVITIYERRF